MGIDVAGMMKQLVEGLTTASTKFSNMQAAAYTLKHGFSPGIHLHSYMATELRNPLKIQGEEETVLSRSWCVAPPEGERHTKGEVEAKIGMELELFAKRYREATDIEPEKSEVVVLACGGQFYVQFRRRVE